MPSCRIDYQGQADMNVGAPKGKKRQWKGKDPGKGHKRGKGMSQRKGKGYKGKRTYKGKGRAKDTKKRKISERNRQRTRMFSMWRPKPLKKGMPEMKGKDGSVDKMRTSKEMTTNGVMDSG